MSELLGRETVRLIEDWMARIEADPQGGEIGSLYRHAFLALAANPLLRALYGRESQVLGAFVRRRGPEIYTPRYLASLETVQALQRAGILRKDVSPGAINHVLLLLQVGLFSVGEVFDPALFPPLEVVAQTLSELLQRALAPDVPVDTGLATTAIRTHFTRLRSQIVSSFPESATP